MYTCVKSAEFFSKYYTHKMEIWMFYPKFLKFLHLQQALQTNQQQQYPVKEYKHAHMCTHKQAHTHTHTHAHTHTNKYYTYCFEVLSTLGG